MKNLHIKFLIWVTLTTCVSAFSQVEGRKLYPGSTKNRGVSNIPLNHRIAYKWTWMIGIGRASYLGTLCQTGDCYFKFTDLNFQINAGLKYRFTNRISMGASIRYFNIASNDNQYGTFENGRKQRNLSFSTNGGELMVFGNFDIIPIIDNLVGEIADQYSRRNLISPYITAGIGILYFNPTTILDGKTIDLSKVITDDQKEKGQFYSLVTPVLMAGAGVRVKITEFFDVGADFTINRPFTQYLDDVSATSKYPTWNLDPSKAPDDISWRLADRHEETGYQRVDPTSSQPFRGNAPDKSSASADYYFIFNLRLDYTLSAPFKFDNPRHAHFEKGKGSKHHHFNSR